MMNEASVFWACAGIAAVCLFFVSLVLIVLCFRQKQFFLLLPELGLMAMCYFILQCVSTYTSGAVREKTVMAVTAWMVSLPKSVIIALLLLTGIVFLGTGQNIYRNEKTRITSTSVKEAADNLPSGICFYQDGGRIIMSNRMMGSFCRKVTGDLLINGEQFRDRLFSDNLAAGCRTVQIGRTKVILTDDEMAWSVTEKDVLYQKKNIHMLMISDITDNYYQTLSLQEMQDKLSALNDRLSEYNREIVALTAEKELLSARVRVHDEMGADLLKMKQFIQSGGSEQERADIEARLRRSVSFLKAEQISPARDEYELMLETAAKLGVRVVIDGTLPQTEPQKHIIATAIHECFTNTLRHARGDELTIVVREHGDRLAAVFTNNGKQPEGEVRAKGGLLLLKTMAERAGGRMILSTAPVYSVTVDLPKEAAAGI